MERGRGTFMYDIKMRVVIVTRRVSMLHRKRENRLTARLSVLCLMLMGSLIGVIRAWGGGGQGRVTGLYGTMMLLKDAGGYVLVGVIAFILAVAITVLCIRYREREKKIQDKHEEDQNENDTKKSGE